MCSFFDLMSKTNILLSVVVVVVDAVAGSDCVDSAVDFPFLDRYLIQTK